MNEDFVPGPRVDPVRIGVTCAYSHGPDASWPEREVVRPGRTISSAGVCRKQDANEQTNRVKAKAKQNDTDTETETDVVIVASISVLAPFPSGQQPNQELDRG